MGRIQRCYFFGPKWTGGPSTIKVSVRLLDGQLHNDDDIRVTMRHVKRGECIRLSLDPDGTYTVNLTICEENASDPSTSPFYELVVLRRDDGDDELPTLPERTPRDANKERFVGVCSDNLELLNPSWVERAMDLYIEHPLDPSAGSGKDPWPPPPPPFY